MTDREWHSKDGKVVRKNSRRVVNKCNRPFTAPRRVVEEIVDHEVQIITESEANQNVISKAKTQDISDSEVQFVTETENAREIDARERQLESDTTESTPDIFKPPSTAELESETTASTPDILKSPESDIGMPVSLCNPSDFVGLEEESVIRASPARQQTLDRTLRGAKKVTVPETQFAENEAHSDDDIPVVRLLRPRTKTSLTAQQIADCQERTIRRNLWEQ
jgi:hypothetical protein